MAEQDGKTPRRIKKVETVREKAEKVAAQDGKQPRRIHEKTRRVSAPIRKAGRGVGKVGRFIVPPYFRNSWKELRLVTWPSFRDSLRLTFAVIAFAVVFGVLVALLDLGLGKVFEKVLIG